MAAVNWAAENAAGLGGEAPRRSYNRGIRYNQISSRIPNRKLGLFRKYFERSAPGRAAGSRRKEIFFEVTA